MKAADPVTMIFSIPESYKEIPFSRPMGFVIKANQFLVPAVVVLAIGSLCYFWFYPERQALSVEKEIKTASEVSSHLSVAEVLPSIPIVGIKNIFEPVSSIGTAVSVDVGAQFKISGIILDGHPQAVLYDRQANRSIFVHKGDHVAGFVVKDIKEGKVVLSMQDHDWELMP